MKTYTIYIKQTNPDNINIEYIPEKFNFFGFLFNLFWLIYHRLWIYTAVYSVLLIIVLQAVMGSWQVTLLILFSIIIGITGNDLLRKQLIRQGYKFHDVVIASCESEAELKFITMNYKDRLFKE